MEKGPQSNESYESENPWNRTISTVLWVHRKLPQSTVKLVLPSNESYESKTGCNRTPATVLWVPLRSWKKDMQVLVATLVAFHPRPQIASDLGRNVTRSFNPHGNRNRFPSGNEILAYGRRFKSQPASTRCDLRIASPTRPFLQVIWTPQIANPQVAIAELGPPGGRKSQNRRPQGTHNFRPQWQSCLYLQQVPLSALLCLLGGRASKRAQGQVKCWKEQGQSAET